jgi:hypothetical protein
MQLAEEAEVSGDTTRCEALLLEALALAPSADCWHSYALACARAGRLARWAAGSKLRPLYWLMPPGWPMYVGSHSLG